MGVLLARLGLLVVLAVLLARRVLRELLAQPVLPVARRALRVLLARLALQVIKARVARRAAAVQRDLAARPGLQARMVELLVLQARRERLQHRLAQLVPPARPV